MKIFRNSFLGLLVLFGTNIALKAQLVNAQEYGGSPIRVTAYDKIEGSPYMFNGDWYDGVIVTQTDQRLTDNKIRYNAYEDQLQYLNKGNPFYYRNQDVKSFEFEVVDDMGNLQRYYFRNGFEYEDEISKKNFLRVVYEGDNVLLLEDINIIKQSVTPAAYGESDYDKFIETQDTYILINGKMEEFKLRKGKVLKAFPGEKQEIKQYLKENSISFSSSDDINSLFSFIDEQISM